MKPPLFDDLADERYGELSAGLELEDVGVFAARQGDPVDSSLITKALGAAEPASQSDESKFSLARPGAGEELARLHGRRWRHRSAPGVNPWLILRGERYRSRLSAAPEPAVD